MEGTPDRGSLGLVTGPQVSSILAGRVSSFGFTWGVSWLATGVSEARSVRSSGWADNAQPCLDRSAEAGAVA